ncbi:MAG: SAM-dependent methyltransferase [Pseudomonadota bacterium]|nr:SAM-dependent methyltransferase [Pseudomonadota bacterium]
MSLFGGRASSAGAGALDPRLSRHSSGWSQLSNHLRGHESLRILDIGPTSAGNINFITSLGHSVYMANLVEDATRPEYLVVHPDDIKKTSFNVDRYLNDNLDFSGRVFDVVTLWDTADYLPEALVQPVIDRIHGVMEAGGQLLAFFHSKTTGDDTTFSRYHLTANDQVQMQRIGVHPILRTYTTRQVEHLFKNFASYKFFLAKDTLREVIVTR